MCENIQETMLHLDGVQKMLTLVPSSQLSDSVKEILFWYVIYVTPWRWSAEAKSYDRSDLIGSALCHTPPRQFIKRPSVRSFYHPLFLNPRSTVGLLCRGFRKVIVRSSSFSNIAGILHDLRCLTTVLHYSRCKGLPRHDMPVYSALCYAVRHKLELLPLMGGSPLFECCRIAVMVFTDSVLLDDGSNLGALALGLRTVLDNSQMADIAHEAPQLLLWVLFMGIVASRDRDGNRWFNESFVGVLSTQQWYNWQAARTILAEFLWLEDILDEKLERTMAAVEKTAIN